MDWKKYEQITKYIYETLGKEAGVKIEGYGNNCKVKGKSGIKHQIDVLTSHTDGIHVYKTAIECKYWNDTVNKDIIMKIAEIIQDSAIHKGVIVSKNGFTDDAMKFAEHKNVGLVELREFSDKEIEEQLPIKHFKSILLRPKITKLIIMPSLFNRSEYDYEEVNPELMVVERNIGEKTTVWEIMKEFMKDIQLQPVNKKIQKKILLPMAKLINSKNAKVIFIDGIILQGVLTERDAGLKIHYIDEIWLKLKFIFEKKSYTISKSGAIVEDKK